MMLSDVCLMSVTYIGPKSRTDRPRKTTIGTKVAHITRDSDTTFKVNGQGHRGHIVAASRLQLVKVQIPMTKYLGFQYSVNYCCHLCRSGVMLTQLTVSVNKHGIFRGRSCFN